MDFLVERIIEEPHDLGLGIQVTVAAHTELAVTQPRKYTVITNIRIAGVERPRLLKRTVQSHKRIVRFIGTLNRKRRDNVVKRLLRERQRVAPPIEDVCVHAKCGNVCILRNLNIWRNGVHLRIRVHLPQMRKIFRAVNNENAQTLRTRREEFKQIRPHRAKSPCSAHRRSISPENAAR